MQWRMQSARHVEGSGLRAVRRVSALALGDDIRSARMAWPRWLTASFSSARDLAECLPVRRIVKDGSYPKPPSPRPRASCPSTTPCCFEQDTIGRSATASAQTNRALPARERRRAYGGPTADKSPRSVRHTSRRLADSARSGCPAPRRAHPPRSRNPPPSSVMPDAARSETLSGARFPRTCCRSRSGTGMSGKSRERLQRSETSGSVRRRIRAIRISAKLCSGVGRRDQQSSCASAQLSYFSMCPTAFLCSSIRSAMPFCARSSISMQRVAAEGQRFGGALHFDVLAARRS